MSSLSGEQALKEGVSFEFTWTARHLLEVMEERAEGMTIGGLLGESGVDFRLHFSDHEEHHQVKRAFGREGTWTFASLDSTKVLPDFKGRLADPRAHCFLVSGIPAICLDYLAERARKAADLADFESSYLATKNYQDWFNDLILRWKLSAEECWHRLKRVHAIPYNEREIEQSSLSMLRAMVLNDSIDVWTHLRDFCFKHVHQRVTASEIWQWLAARGIERQYIIGDIRVLPRLQGQTRQYLNSIRRKLINPPLRRKTSQSIIEVLSSSSNGKDLIVLGEPGGGKSAVMLQIAEDCMQKGWPVLAFRLDELRSDISASELQQSLGLPLPPATSMALASAGKAAVVIIDQLDAVSQYSGRTGTLFDRVSDFVEQLRGLRLRHPIHLIIACREVDWRYDGNLRQLQPSHEQNKDEGVHRIESLTDDEVKSILTEHGFNIGAFTPRQKEQLLRRPQYLALLIDAKPSADSLQGIVTPKHLFDAYWNKKEREFVQAFKVAAGNPWQEILKGITNKLAETALALAPPAGVAHDDAPLAVSRSLLGGFAPTIVDWMITNGVLSEGKGRIRFGHESFFDYCFARFFEERRQTLHDYLVHSEQTFIQRGQLRQVLAYQRDEDIEIYLTYAVELLRSDKIRPHLKHLLASLLCDVPDPTEPEWNLIEPIIDEALHDIDSGITTTVACQVFSAFHNSLPLFRMACEKGKFSIWLQESGPTSVQSLFQVILRHQEKAQSQVWQLIAPLIKESKFDQPLDRLSHYCHASDSRETFEWLMSLMQESHSSNSPLRAGERFYTLAHDLAENKPEWFAEWIAALILIRARSKRDYRYEILNDLDVQVSDIEPAVMKAPRAFLNHLLPAIEIAMEDCHPTFFDFWSDDEDESRGSRYISLDQSLMDALLEALLALLQEDYSYAFEVIAKLRCSKAEPLKMLHMAILCQDKEICASLAAVFLTEERYALHLSYKGKNAVACMMKVHGERFTPSDILQMEGIVLQCWPKKESRRIGQYEGNEPYAFLGNWRGYRQMIILRAFPSERLSKLGSRRLAELERKFDSIDKIVKPRSKISPVNKDVITGWSPEQFLSSIATRINRRSEYDGHNYDRGGGVIRELLNETVSKRPDEFIKYLGKCDTNTPKIFLEAISDGLANVVMGSQSALEGAKQFHRLGQEWSWRTLRLLEKIKPGSSFDEAFNLALEYARHGSSPVNHSPVEEGKRGDRLQMMAADSGRGQGIGIIRQLLWADPDILSKLRPVLPGMMKDPCPAIRAELASLCYAIAFKEENRAFATELFLQLVSCGLPDEHVLSSHWPVKFFHAGLKEQWGQFAPTLIRMIGSASSEVRCAGARLVCIVVLSGIEATDLVQSCVNSSDPKVRTACAEVLSYNVGAEGWQSWCTEALLQLADDSDNEVCRVTGFTIRRKKDIDFRPLSELIKRYVKTRAFVRGSERLFDSIAESRTVVPDTIFDIVEAFAERLCEPVENDSARLSWRIDTVSAVLVRLYHENRDKPLRRRALNLIDQLCILGSFKPDSLDS